MDGFGYVRLSADERGASRFDDVEAEFESRDFAPPAAPLSVAALGDATGAFLLVGGSAGWRGEVAHPTPRRQVFCVLAGRFTITASGGSTREFAPGDLLLLEDTWGEGHSTHFLTERVVVAATALTG